ncbi:unnamed protein product [Fraxinus pennsylvanica]|uniref:Uncharacterized protein n=1 Tax=Fraxinus pennsylvanica TaxID=56036 RepID=A0AAD1ZNT0_9LAMI|nr:unnamed protein product [Fraxinus pennsylvanica]
MGSHTCMHFFVLPLPILLFDDYDELPNQFLKIHEEFDEKKCIIEQNQHDDFAIPHNYGKSEYQRKDMVSKKEDEINIQDHTPKINGDLLHQIKGKSAATNDRTRNMTQQRHDPDSSRQNNPMMRRMTPTEPSISDASTTLPGHDFPSTIDALEFAHLPVPVHQQSPDVVAPSPRATTEPSSPDLAPTLEIQQPTPTVRVVNNQLVWTFSSWFKKSKDECNLAEGQKKRLIFPGKSSTKKKKKNVLSKLEISLEGDGNPKQSKPSEHHDALDDVQRETIFRKSTTIVVIIRQVEMDAIHSAQQATIKVY